MENSYNIAYLSTFNKMYLSKDTFLIPYYTARVQNKKLEVIYGSNTGDVRIDSEYRETHFYGKNRKTINKTDEIWDWMCYILPKARKINSLFFCGCSAHHMFLTWILLKINPLISVIVFGDMEEPQAKEFLVTGLVYGKGLGSYIKRKLTQYFFNHIKFTVANERAYELMELACKKYSWNCLVKLYPCLDDEIFNQYGMKIKSWQEKDNIMIYVGRIGNYQKNTDMLLNTLSKVNLKDWKVYLIGPITDSFAIGKESNYKVTIENFFIKYPEFKEKIIFTGIIYDQRTVFDYFLRAKVLLSSARHEGFANVYSQAAACGCYIVSTDVGGAKTASNGWKFGRKIEQDDAEGMARVIQSIVDDKSDINLNNRPNPVNFMYSHEILKLV